MKIVQILKHLLILAMNVHRIIRKSYKETRTRVPEHIFSMVLIVSIQH